MICQTLTNDEMDTTLNARIFFLISKYVYKRKAPNQVARPVCKNCKYINLQGNSHSIPCQSKKQPKQDA